MNLQSWVEIGICLCIAPCLVYILNTHPILFGEVLLLYLIQLNLVKGQMLQEQRQPIYFHEPIVLLEWDQIRSDDAANGLVVSVDIIPEIAWILSDDNTHGMVDEIGK